MPRFIVCTILCRYSWQHHKHYYIQKLPICAQLLKNYVLVAKFANTRSTKALSDYFALAASQPTPATLERQQKVSSEKLFLNFQDKNANFFLPVSWFETRTSIEIKTILAIISENEICCSFLD